MVHGSQRPVAALNGRNAADGMSDVHRCYGSVVPSPRPDKSLALNYIVGFPVVFNIPDSGVYKAETKAAEVSPAEFMRGNTRMLRSPHKYAFSLVENSVLRSGARCALHCSGMPLEDRIADSVSRASSSPVPVVVRGRQCFKMGPSSKSCLSSCLVVA